MKKQRRQGILLFTSSLSFFFFFIYMGSQFFVAVIQFGLAQDAFTDYTEIMNDLMLAAVVSLFYALWTLIECVNIAENR